MTPGTARPPPERAFTPKALAAGLAGAGTVCLAAGFNDEVLTQTPFIGNHIPFSALSFVLALSCLWNPLAAALARGRAFPRVGRALVFSAKETVVVLVTTLAACWAPTSGFGRYFARVLVMPRLRVDTNPGWARALSHWPDGWAPDGWAGRAADAADVDRRLYEQVYEAFATGTAGAGWLDWPWQAWLGVLAHWLPLAGCFALGLVALYGVVHRQWAHHEQLPYPIAAVTASFLDRAPGRLLPPAFYRRTFWCAAALALAFHALRVVHLYWDQFPAPDQAWSLPWGDVFPSLSRSGLFEIQRGALFFSIIGLMYFLPSETGLTVGLSQFLLAGVAWQYYSLAGRPLSRNDVDTARYGAYVAYGLMALWVGRHWYWRILLRALGLRRGASGDARAEADPAAWLRVFLLAYGGFAAAMAASGMDWALALMASASLFWMATVFTRLVCEMGLPFLNVHHLQAGFLKMIGYVLAGPRAAAVTLTLQGALFYDPREALQPYAATAARVAEARGVRPGRALAWFAVAALAAGLFAWGVRNAGFYRWGGAVAVDPHAYNTLPNRLMNDIRAVHSTLDLRGELEIASNGGFFARLAQTRPERDTLGFVLAGAGAVFVFGLLRRRFTGWPLHPALFLIWSTYPVEQMGQSALIAWAIRAGVVYIGGGKVYQDLKPLFLGLVAGDLLAGGGLLLFGFGYYFVTGNVPQEYHVLPR